jgi:hypothetical protein
MSLDLSKLQAVISSRVVEVTKLQTDVPAAIKAAAGGASDAANQAAIDNVTQALQGVSDSLTSLDASISPAPTQPPAAA